MEGSNILHSLMCFITFELLSETTSNNQVIEISQSEYRAKNTKKGADFFRSVLSKTIYRKLTEGSLDKSKIPSAFLYFYISMKVLMSTKE